jgi:hypothetical protein
MLVFTNCGKNIEDPEPPARPEWVGKTSPYDTTEAGIDADPSSNAIVLEWRTGSEDDLASYRIYRATGSDKNDFAFLDEVNAGASAGSISNYADEDISIGTKYFYFLRVVDLANNFSPRSDTLEYELIPKVNLLSPTGTITSNKPDFVWRDLNSLASEYVIRVAQFSPNTTIWLAAVTRQNYTGESQVLHFGNGTVFYQAQAELTPGIDYRWRIDAIADVDRNNVEIAGSESEWKYFIIE